MAEIRYQLRPATEADYQYCYDLLKQNMFELFSRHWGGWNPDAFRQDFCAANTTIVIIEGRDIGYFSLKETEVGLYLENVQLLPSVQGQGIGTVILKRIDERLGFEVVGREGETIRMLKSVEQFSDPQE